MLFLESIRKSKEEIFWKWFEKNQDIIFEFEKDREKIFNKLNKKLNKIHDCLTFEFSPILENGKREFVISADGIKDAFPFVEKLYSVAPKLQKWKFLKFRQRRNPINDIRFNDKKIKISDVQYQLYQDDNPAKISLVLFLPDYNEDERNTYATIGYLLLDEALGEYDVELRLGYIDFKSHNDKDYEGSKPLTDLPGEFDSYFSAQNN